MAQGTAPDRRIDESSPASSAPDQWRATATLSGLTFAAEGLDRCSDQRSDPDLVPRLLRERSTVIVPLRAGRLGVHSPQDPVPGIERARPDPGLPQHPQPSDEALTADRGPRLWTRSPQPSDSAPDRLAVFLGRTLGGERTAYVGVVEPEPHPDQGGGRPGTIASVGSKSATSMNGARDQARPSAPSPTEQSGTTPEGVQWRGLRSIAVTLPPWQAGLAATLTALANWHATHTHCARCGAPTAPVQAGWVRRCTVEGSEHFPRTDPAVIMAVVDDADRLLLARGAGFSSTGMSVLAGFVEPGESLAAAVGREVAEEVGVEVTDVTYLGDQPWPFPTGLMIGFRARALTTDLSLQDGEIESARWFTREEFAAALTDDTLHISGRLSIARRLIEHWWGGPLDVPERTLRG